LILTISSTLLRFFGFLDPCSFGLLDGIINARTTAATIKTTTTTTTTTTSTATSTETVAATTTTSTKATSVCRVRVKIFLEHGI